MYEYLMWFSRMWSARVRVLIDPDGARNKSLLDTSDDLRLDSITWQDDSWELYSFIGSRGIAAYVYAWVPRSEPALCRRCPVSLFLWRLYVLQLLLQACMFFTQQLVLQYYYYCCS